MDESLGPVAISLKRERLERPASADSNSPAPLNCYRILIRTSEVGACNVLVLCYALPLQRDSETLSKSLSFGFISSIRNEDLLRPQILETLYEYGTFQMLKILCTNIFYQQNKFKLVIVF